MDRIELGLSESPAALANDTRVWSNRNFFAWTALSSPTSVTWWNTPVGAGAPGLSLSVGKDQSYPAQLGVGRRHHLLAHGGRIPLPGGHHGLAQPVRGGLAAVQHYGVVPPSPGKGNVIWSPAPSTEFAKAREYPWQTLTRRSLKSLSSFLTGHRVSSLKAQKRQKPRFVPHTHRVSFSCCGECG